MSDEHQIKTTITHLFRHQSGKMVAILTRIFGTHNLELAEDVVQETLMDALQQWKIKGIPDKPESWLFIVAKNKALNFIKKNRSQILFGDDETKILLKSGYTVETTFTKLAEDDLIKDDQLRMMFACCHPDISEENQITLILKTLCGFSTSEIAKAFLTTEDTISKRLYRTKEFYRQHNIKLEIPNPTELKNRIQVVLNVIYLLLNEGYNSTHSENLIRTDLMEEAAVLCKLLTENEKTDLPEVNALMALICFHSSRSDSRLGHGGEIVLLANQDRSKWNKQLIELGTEYMTKAAIGNTLSTYHIEAAIAFEHCSKESFEKTNWNQILKYYTVLEELSPSPITQLNKTIAVLHLYGAQKALEVLMSIKQKKKLESYYLYHSLLGEIYRRLNEKDKSQQHFELAIALTQSEAEKKMLLNKILRLNN